MIIKFKSTGLFSLSPNNFVRFKFANDSAISIKSFTDNKVYSTGDGVRFYVDITKFVDQFKNTDVKEIFLETSDGGYTIVLEGRFQKKISAMVKVLARD